MNRLYAFSPVLLAATLLLSQPALSLDCAVAIHCDDQRLKCECVQGSEGGYCASSGDMVMMLSCERAEGKEGMEILGPLHMGKGRSAVPESDFRFLPVFFPPSNARLDENFSRYMEFIVEAYQQAGLKGYNYLWGNGGIMIDHRPQFVDFRVTNISKTMKTKGKSTRECAGQQWTVNITNYGKVEMQMTQSNENGEIQVEYIRIMVGGSYTESTYSYLVDARSDRPVILDPSHTPKE